MFFWGNMTLINRKECLHYCQKENKKTSRFLLSFQIWFRQVVQRKFEMPYLEMFITTKCNLRSRTSRIPRKSGLMNSIPFLFTRYCLPSLNSGVWMCRRKWNLKKTSPNWPPDDNTSIPAPMRTAWHKHSWPWPSYDWSCERYVRREREWWL